LENFQTARERPLFPIFENRPGAGLQICGVKNKIALMLFRDVFLD